MGRFLLGSFLSFLLSIALLVHWGVQVEESLQGEEGHPGRLCSSQHRVGLACSSLAVGDNAAAGALANAHYYRLDLSKDISLRSFWPPDSIKCEESPTATLQGIAHAGRLVRKDSDRLPLSLRDGVHRHSLIILAEELQGFLPLQEGPNAAADQDVALERSQPLEESGVLDPRQVILARESQVGLRVGSLFARQGELHPSLLPLHVLQLGCAPLLDFC
mmetsp:Transcript_7300/g.21022  ORF Transcript_7300/g.21022 Transcript_7300/m.21022 type:complete len:218 (-) Transcript_7300:1447-2100(-)